MKTLSVMPRPSWLPSSAWPWPTYALDRPQHRSHCGHRYRRGPGIVVRPRWRLELPLAWRVDAPTERFSMCGLGCSSS